MEEVANLIAQAIDSSGGSMEWDACVNAIPVEKRRYFIAGIKFLEQQGTYKRQVTAIPTGAEFRLVKVTV